MSNNSEYENRLTVLAGNICGLFCDLDPSTYDEITPKIEFWVDYVLDERLATTADLADRVSSMAWDSRGSKSDVSRFLKEFRDAPHRSQQARSFVDELCSSVLQWFPVASSEDLWANWTSALVSKSGGPGFIRAASFMGHLIEHSLIDHKLVRRHILKPLTTHYYNQTYLKKQAIRAHAIYELFGAAGNTLLRGLLEPEEVKDCFEKLDTRVSFGDIGGMDQFDAAKLKVQWDPRLDVCALTQPTAQEFREIHAKWLQCRKEEKQRDVTTTELPVPGRVDTPGTPTPQNLPATHIGVDGPSSAANAKNIDPLSLLRGVEFSSDMLIDSGVSTTSSPTLSISTISDLTPTELDIGESNGERTLTRHETFYLKDGDVEIICERTIFRIRSSIVSFTSSRLRDILSPSALSRATWWVGCHRIDFDDKAEDFAVLLKMISTPGFPPWHKVPEFTVFASLLRMSTKYGFFDVCEQLIHSLKGAYPIKWEAFQAASVLGEGVFGSPKPHPNLVLNLFLEQNVRFAIPIAAYRAALGGFPSLINNEPGAALPRLALASAFYGMDIVRSEVSQSAHSIVCDMSLKGCRNRRCVVNGGVTSPEQRMEGLKKIHDALFKEGRCDVLSPPSFCGVVCTNCETAVRNGYDRLRATIWENLPRIFRVGKSWEEI